MGQLPSTTSASPSWRVSGVERDKAEAMRWFRAAADQGHAEAQNHLGVSVRRGRRGGAGRHGGGGTGTARPQRADRRPPNSTSA